MPDRFTPPDEETAQTLRAAIAFIEVFRELHDAMPASYIAAFLSVALGPGQRVTDYAQGTGRLRPVASRNLNEMGQKSRRGRPGHQLLDSVKDPEDGRAVNYYLTPKGKQVVERAIKALNAK